MSEVRTREGPEAPSLAPGRRLNPTAARGIVLVVALALVAPGMSTAGWLGLLPTPSDADIGSPSTASLAAVAKKQVADAYAKLPLSFIPNAGQADPQIRFVAQGPGLAVSFTPGEALLSFVNGERGHVLALRFLEASPMAALTAHRPLPGSVNYFIGDPSEWRIGLQSYQLVAYSGLWPGVDVVFRGAEGKLKYEFRLAPGARVSDVRLGYRGADRLALGKRGDLLIHTPLGTLADARPLSYQWIGGRRVGIDSHYILAQDGTYGFALGPGYDPRRPLVIDPALAYSTFLGGTGQDGGLGIAVDRAGQAYVTGSTTSPNFPTTPGSFDQTLDGERDAFVTKLNPSGSALIYSTFLGGTDADFGHGLAVDPAGYAYVSGRTFSPDFPTTPGAFDTTHNGLYDAFVTKLSPDGSALAYSTFLGGASVDRGNGIAVGPAGHAYVTGATESSDFPTTPGAFDPTYNGGVDAFVTKLRSDGSGLLYSTFLGGASFDQSFGIAAHTGVSSAGHAYVTGSTGSTDFPTTPGAFDPTFNGNEDTFVTKLNPSGSALVYSTFLGGTGQDVGGAGGHGIAVGASGHAYVTGSTTSPDFPTTPGAFDPTYNDLGDAVVTKLTPDGSALDYSTFLGGTSQDAGYDIAVDRAGQTHVTGFTASLDFPTTPGAFDPTYNDREDVFVTKLLRDGSALVYSTFLGEAGEDFGRSIAVDRAGHAYVAGSTTSPGFPTTPEAFDRTHNGLGDAFISKLEIGDKPTR